MFLKLARHSISRADFYRIGDMKKQEAFDFLSRRGVSSNLHEKCYQLAGGRINHLKMLTANLIDKKLSFEGNEINEY